MTTLLKQSLQDGLATRAVVLVGCVHDNDQHQAQGIHHYLPLAAIDPFIAIKAFGGYAHSLRFTL